jgi:hypothetical protein
MTDDMPFAQSGRNDYRWTERAYDLLTQGKLTVTVTGSGEDAAVVATGECPRCDHDVAYSHPEQIVVPDAADAGALKTDAGQRNRRGVYAGVDVVCWCDNPHPDRPASLGRGCGIVCTADVWISHA